MRPGYDRSMDHVVHHKTNPIVENRTDPELIPGQCYLHFLPTLTM